MGFLMFLLKVLFIIAAVSLMALPLLLEYLTFRRDKKEKLTYKRFRIVVFTLLYVIAITIALYFLKELFLWLESLSFVQWVANKVALASRITYFLDVIAAVIVNFAVGMLYRVVSRRIVRIGLKKKNLTEPAKKNGEFSWRQKLERKVLKFFNKEIWFLVCRILKYLSIALSVAYALIFAAYMLPAVFGASWLPYSFISMLFGAGYIYPVITLLALWEIVFFLEGVKRMEEECPELLRDGMGVSKLPVDLKAIEAEMLKQFKDHYICNVDLSKCISEEAASTDHSEIAEFIGKAVENDNRNPQRIKERYLSCIDKLAESENSVIINGAFFSEFSMYFLRYLSVVVARGDNVLFVCNSDAEIDETYRYIKEGFEQISSLFYNGSEKKVNFDNPIWRIVRLYGEKDTIEKASIDDNSILVTSLAYLSSSDFEQHISFISLLDTVVFIDALNTVNMYNRQLAMLNTRLKNITWNNALRSKNGSENKDFKVRYMSRQVRYICFDNAGNSGLDKVLKNLLSVDFVSTDSMNVNANTIVSCYSYEGRADENGRRKYVQTIRTEERIGVLQNAALICLAKGASNVTVFTDDSVPYANFKETISANAGKVSIKADGDSIRINTPSYNPNDYSVLIVMDSGNNLPATLRKYVSMVSDKPSLIIVFSKPYMLRDYYADYINDIWISKQIERIPVEEGTGKNAAQRILVKANAGGISEKEVIELSGALVNKGASDEQDQKEDPVKSALKEVIRIYDLSDQESDNPDPLDYFEFDSSWDFDENGNYNPEHKIRIRRRGKIADKINGRDMLVMSTNDKGSITLPLPKNRLTQNYIAHQNLVYGGEIYNIQKTDTSAGCIYADLASEGKNKEAYKYIQNREYRVDLSPDRIKMPRPKKHVELNRSKEEIAADEVIVSVFRAPTEVLTKGYYAIDPHTMALDTESGYLPIDKPGDDEFAKRAYRRYGEVVEPYYTSEELNRLGHKFSNSSKGALMMLISIKGSFGNDVNKTALTASVMLNELIHSMFPSVADAVAVCPVLSGELAGDDAEKIVKGQPSVTLTGESKLVSDGDFNLMIIEDSKTSLGVVSVLMSAGNDVIKALFEPIFEYLNWYVSSDVKSDYLRFGLDHEPECFDFESLHKLSELLGDDKHDMKFADLGLMTEYEVCDFCGKRYVKGNDIVVLDDGRKMCNSCAASLVGSNKKFLKAHLERARIFLESTYGIVLDDDYEFCFDSTVKVANMLKQHREFLKRGSDIPLKSYIDEKKNVHIETSVPSASLSELLVRELTHVWQLKHLPGIKEELAEGHIALVDIQYLRFLNFSSLASVRTTYYESTDNISGDGYRKLVRALLDNPQYNNNPFRYLLEAAGISDGGIITPPPRAIEDSDLGLAYTPEKPDRTTKGELTYFYYSRLTATYQKVYDALLNAIQNHEASVVIEGCSFNELSKIDDAVRYDHPELFWYTTFSMSGETVTLHYGASAEEAAVIQRQIDEALPRFLGVVNDSMSAYDAALRLHLKVISETDYDSVALKKQKQEGGPAKDEIDRLRTIYGVFLDGKAVCEGYARAMQYLLQRCGIECAECAGNIKKGNRTSNESHAWIITKIDGDYYYIDTTWDDESNTVQSVRNDDFGFDYFCITEEEIARTRDINLCPVDMPRCIATRANYYTHNDLVLTVYDLERIKAIAQRAAGSGRKSFTFKCESASLFEDALKNLCSSGEDCYDVLKCVSKVYKQINGLSYSYIYDRNIRTITIKFKYK